MKIATLLFLSCLFALHTNAQIIITIAGSGPGGYAGGGYSGDGGLATDAQLFLPSGVAVDSFGNVFIVDATNSRIRKIDAAGIITTIAGTDTAGFSGDGGPATAAQLDNPSSIALDKHRNIYISDNGVIRKIDMAGLITRFAGIDMRGSYFTTFTGDGGPMAL